MPGKRDTPEWVSDDVLLDLWNNQGMTLKEIADHNKSVTGYRKNPSSVSRRLRRLGVPSPRIEYKKYTYGIGVIRPEHRKHPLYYGVQALSVELDGYRQGSKEHAKADHLRRLLRGNQKNGVPPQIVTYDPETEDGWDLVPRAAADGEDIVRKHLDL